MQSACHEVEWFNHLIGRLLYPDGDACGLAVCAADGVRRCAVVSAQVQITSSARGTFPTWQWACACSSAVNSRAVI
jgi:hypothetical protein